MSADFQTPAPFTIPSYASTFAVQCLRLEDLPALFALERRSHPHPWREENLRSSLQSHSCFGLRYGDDWIAHAVLSFVVGEAELLLFVVEKSWQGKGIGKRFLQELVGLAAQRAQTLFLEVRESNVHAIALYESLGFNQVGMRPGYYPAASGRRENALLYALDLMLD